MWLAVLMLLIVVAVVLGNQRGIRRRMREYDMAFLWPALKEQAKDADHAKAGFYAHVVNDPAWTKDFTFPQLQEFVDRLE